MDLNYMTNKEVAVQEMNQDIYLFGQSVTLGLTGILFLFLYGLLIFRNVGKRRMQSLNPPISRNPEAAYLADQLIRPLPEETEEERMDRERLYLR